MKLAIAGVVLLILVAAGILYARISSVPDYKPGRLGSFVSWDSGLYPGIAPPLPQWMDNDTIVYVGNFSPKPSPSVASRLTDSIIIWHLGDAPVQYTDERWTKLHGSVCAADGRIVYPVEVETTEEGNRIIKIEEGTPGHFRECQIDYQPKPGPFGAGNSNPCDFYDDPRMDDHRWITDHSRKFYLDFGSIQMRSHPDSPVLLLSSNVADAPISLPVTRRQAPSFCTEYHSFSDLFYLWGCGGAVNSFDADNCVLGYWTVNPETGNTERHCIRSRQYSIKNWDQIIPTAQGFFLISEENLTANTVGSSGLFKSDDQELSLVIRGFVRNAAVSPDGCRIAFSYAKTLRDTSIGTPGRYSVVAIDVCKGK